ncbi:TIGR00730 family Rossman fold protein [Rhodobacteraceae bacterium RKSG542]|nr:TIGR00730 family Rossman fold protein [Pseudovibrio flavus]
MSAVCVYCGSSMGVSPHYAETAFETGRQIALAGKTLVYGGAQVGLMGRVADGALSEGGKVIGVLPEALAAKELAHTGLTKLHIVGSMHERKAMMNDLSDAFITLPGGAGSMEEMFEIWTWAQLGYHTKPSGVLNAGGYYAPLLTMLDRMVSEGFLKQDMRDILKVAETPQGLLDAFESYEAPKVMKWVTKDQL